MDAALLKLPLSQRINLRPLVFAGVIVFLLAWPVYTFLSETLTAGVHDRGSYKEVDLKAMCCFRMDPITATLKDIPAAYRALDGQKVMLTGLVLPRNQSGSEITGFSLLYSYSCGCGMGGQPQVQEKVFATAPPGRPLHFNGEAYSKVLGTLHVTMKRNDIDGQIIEVYHLDAESIKPM
jgi:hypothetical protein